MGHFLCANILAVRALSGHQTDGAPTTMSTMRPVGGGGGGGQGKVGIAWRTVSMGKGRNRRWAEGIRRPASTYYTETLFSPENPVPEKDEILL